MRPSDSTRRPSHPGSPVQPGSRGLGPIVAALVLGLGVGWQLGGTRLGPEDFEHPERIDLQVRDVEVPQKIAVLMSRQQNALLSAFSSDDYPDEALRRGEEGAVRYALEIDKSGNPSCTVVEGSGSKALDRTTCDILERQKFVESDTPTTLKGRVRWVLPR